MFAVASGVLAAALLVFLGLIAIYILLITLGAWFSGSRRGHASGSTPRFAIIVPAHDEEDGIQVTLDDLANLDYSKDAYDVFVIADNCTDRTADIARAGGVNVAERSNPNLRGKGQALDWFLTGNAERLRDYDLVAFIDSDARINREFLAVMARRFEDTAIDVVQSRYTVNPDVRSWVSAIGFASFAYVNHVRLAGKCFWGGAASLKGSGMVFRRELILRTGWPAHSIAEDVEFGKDLLLEGVSLHYEPRAVISSDIPPTLAQAQVQQSRWEGGNLHVAAKFVWPALKMWIRRPTKVLLFELIEFLVPPLSIIVLLAAVGAGAAALSGSFHAALFLLPLMAFGTAVLTGLVQLRPPAKVWLLLMCAPVFLVWKLVLMAKVMFVNRPSEWRRTPRTAR